MNLAEISVRRPVTTSMLYLGLLLLGFISIFKLPQAMYPEISFPQLTVMTKYGNAAPEEVETLITKVIEEAVGTVSNLKRVTSKSKEGVSMVTAEFSWGTNMDFAALNMREKIDLVKARLPRDSGEPIVLKFNPLELPVIILSVTGERSDVEMLRFVRRSIKESLEKVEGVAACAISGGIDREIHVDINKAQLMASQIALSDVTEALSSDNLNYPAGTVKENFYEYLIRSIGEYNTVQDIRDMIVSVDDRDELKRNQDKGSEYLADGVDESKGAGLGKRLIPLSQIATITDGKKERRSYSRYNGEANISLSVQKQAIANVIDVADKVKKELKKVQEILPEDIHVDVVYDQSLFVKRSVRDVVDAIWQGGLIAFLVLLYFLKDLRGAIVVSVSIPISILVTFSMMFFQGVSLNMMSLSGLALGGGMMVDNCIVVIENIARWRSMGKRPKEAAIEGTQEVAASVISSTLTTVAVFLPIGFVTGIAGQMFKDLAFTVNYSSLISMFVSLTLLPCLASYQKDYKKNQRHQAGWVTALEYPFLLFVRMYHVALRLFLKNKFIGLSLIIITFIGSVFLFASLQKEMMPKVDQGEFVLKVTLPAGTVLDATNDIVHKIEEVIKARPDVHRLSLQVGSDRGDQSSVEAINSLEAHEGKMTVLLRKPRVQPTADVIKEVRQKLTTLDLKAARVDFIQSDAAFVGWGGGDSSAPLVIEVKGTQLQKIKQIADGLQEKLKSIPGLIGVKNDYAMPSPEVKVVIDKDKASLHGLSVTDISQTAQIALKGSVATKFKEEGKEIDVLVRLREEDRKSFGTLQNINMYSKSMKQDVPLSSLATLYRGLGPSEIVRKDQQKVITVMADLNGRGLEETVADVQNMIDRMRIPSQYSVAIAGESEQMKASFRSLIFAFVLTVLLIYMIMAAQFESLLQPFLIMFTIPLALIGVSLTLYVTDTPVNIMVILGIIMLAGIVVNNAIVLISAANDFRAMGDSAYDAIVKACKVRLRPVMMTAMSTVMGLIPLALELGEGSEMQAPMAKTVMGGLSMATFLTLFVIPSLYLIAENVMDVIFKRERLVMQDGD